MAENALAGTFVARRGAIGAGAAMGAGGLVGAGIAVAQDKKGRYSPLNLGGEMGYLTVTPVGIVLYKTKKSLVGLKPKVSEEVLAEVARSDLATSQLKKGKIVSVLQLAFSDGSTWEFDVARQHRKDAEQVAQALGSSIE